MKSFNLVKSLTRVINNSKGLLILCLITSVFGVNDAWGTGSSYEVTVQASPTGGGMVYVGNETPTHKEENKNPYKFSLSAQPNENYNFKKWEKIGNGDIEAPTNLNTNISYTPEKKTQYKATVTAIFTRMTTNVQSIAFGEKNVGTPYPSNITLTTGNAGTVTITLQNNTGNYFSITGDVGTYTSGGTEDTKNIVVNYEPKAAGTHSATLQITGSNGMTTINIPLSGSAKSMGEMSWKPNTNVMNVGDVLTEENLTYSDGSRQIVFTTDNPDAVKINDSGYPEAVGEGTANITAKQEANDSWYETSASQEITVTNKQKQTITWDDDLSFKFTGSAITQSLTATATSGMAVNYSPTSGSFFTIENGQLKITGIGEAQLTATQAGNEDWMATSLTRRLVSRDPNATCDDPIYEGGEHTLKTIDSWEQDISSYGEPRTIQFKAKKSSNLAVGDGIKLHQFYDGDWHEVKNIARGDLGTDYKSFGPYDLNRKTTKIKFLTEVGSTLNRSFTDIFITRAKYLESKTNAIDFGNVGFGNSASRTFLIDYSNIQGPLVTSCDNSCYTISPTEIGSDCGDYQKNVTVIVTFHASAAGQQNGKIHLTDEKVDRGGLELYIDVSANVTKTAQDIIWEPQTTYNSTDKPTLSATATSGLAISSYSSDNESIAKVVNGNQMEFYSSGKVNITAHQDGNDFYEPASLTKEFTINKVTPTIVTLPTVGNAITYGQTLSDVALTGGSAKDDKNNAVTGHFEWVNPNEIPHGGQQNYTVRFVPDNTNMYTSDAVSTETLAITVNKANQTLTWEVEDPIKIKKENGDYTLTASSTSGRAITYTLSDPTLGTINGNILTPLKSGDCKITAICIADDDYNASNSIEKKLYIAGPDEIVWKYKTGDRVWAGQNLNADGELATAHTTVWFGKDETQGYLTVDNGTDPKTVYTTNASDDVLVTISATTAGDDYYARVESSIQVYIDRCYQGLNWDQSFVAYTATAEGYIDETVPLTAVAVDSLNKPTNLPILYSVNNADVAEITGNATDGWKLHIKGAGEATLTASVAQTNIYQGVTETRKINVRKEGERCGSYALISTGEKNISDINDNTYTFDVPGETLTFKTRKYVAITLNANVTVEGYNISNNAWVHIDQYKLDFTSNQTKTYTINENIRKIKMYTDADLENSYRYISDLYITQKEYIRPSVTEINENIFINQDFSKTFTVDYSDKPYINCTIDNDNLELVRSGADNDCGTYGTLTFTIKNKEVWDTPREYNATITLTTSVGDKKEIPVHIKVDLGATYKFTNKIGDGDWKNLNNWDYGGVVPSSLPQTINPVEIQQPVRISSNVDVYSLTVQNDAQQGTQGSVTIAPTGGLTVYNGGVTGLNDKLIIESSRENTGYFRVAPNVVKGWAAKPTATVQYATKGTLDSGANKDATWQYFGVTADGVKFTADYITWLYDWDETQGWVNLKDNQEHDLKPFHGYAITQYGQPIYDFHGQLLMNNVEITLTKTSSGMDGENMIANSFPAPIDAKRFTDDDFVAENINEDLDLTFYLFNSGSWKDWNTKTNQGSNLEGDAPGTFTAIPLLSSVETGAQSLVAPGQGICMRTYKVGTKIKLNYEKHVWYASPSAGESMNAGLKAPQRNANDEDILTGNDAAMAEVERDMHIRDSIAQEDQRRIDALRHRVRLDVYGSNSGADHLFVLEKDDYTTAYDNGCDAPKMFADGLANIYANEVDGLMAVAATNDVNEMFIGFNAGEDVNYELYITSVIGDDLELMDMQTGDRFALKDSVSYAFAATPNSEDPYRFRIFKSETKPVVPTGWTGLGDKAKIWYNKQVIYISDAAANSTAAIYTADGVTLKQVTFNHNTTISTADIPEGVYTVRVEDSVLKIFVKH